MPAYEPSTGVMAGDPIAYNRPSGKIIDVFVIQIRAVSSC